MRNDLLENGNIFKRWTRKSLHAVAACGLLFGAGFLQSCEKDILTGQPEWLGNSIYERLQEGITVNDGSTKTFNYTLRLIDDLGYKETLLRTGSKTIFAAPDEAYEAWFAANGKTYDQLSTAQKKRLFNNSMINNAFLIELMSNVSGNPPEEGYCMRRETASTIYDSIPSMTLAEMPVDPFTDPEMDAWALRRAAGKDVAMYKDDTSAPMIHFLPAFMQKQKITDADLMVISNGNSNSIADSWINGKKVISKEQTCKNGYIYVIDGVVDGTQSMADIINTDPRTTTWSKFINRWSAPYPITGNALREYQTLFNTQDSIYSLRYFNSGASTSRELLKLPHMEKALTSTNTLLFDPGWNQYIYDDGKDLHYDAGVMFVPTDEAFNEWWQTGSGKPLRELYGDIENIPYATLAALLRVNMKESFIDAVPSKFSTVLDDEQKPMGITEANIVESVMGCNGVVYIVNKVFAPVKYRSVIYPTLLHGSGDAKLTVMYNVINAVYPSNDFTETEPADPMKDFVAYLNSLDSRYEVVVPYNSSPSGNTATPTRKVFRYIDPCSYGLTQQNLMEFYYEKEMIRGVMYKCTTDAEGNIVPDYSRSYDLIPDIISNRLFNLLDNNIIVGELTPGREYYTTKGGAIVRATTEGGNVVFEGGYQLDYGKKVVITPENTYTQDNGHTYCCADEKNADENLIDVPLTGTKTVYQVLKEAAEAEGSKCTLFYKLLSEDPTNKSLLSNEDGSYKCANPSSNFNMSVFDSYNYTVYIPSDDAINELISNGYLPTWDDYAGDKSKQDTVVANRIHNFLKYHIQDRAVCINGEPVNGDTYESGLLNDDTKRFYTYTVSANSEGLTVVDNSGNTRNVVKTNGLWNKICREYWIKGTPGLQTATLDASSDAVVHEIDGVLFYDETYQKTRWMSEL